MNLETLAALGEFIGGVAVLATIGYLAYQTRQTRRLLEQSAEQQAGSMLRANIDGWNQMWSTILTDQETTGIYGRMMAGDTFLEEERVGAEILATMYFLNLENLLVQNQKSPFFQGVEDALEGVTRHHARSVLSSPTLQAWWEREKVAFGPPFRAAIDRALTDDGR